MKAISVKPYWATLILSGNKTIECRTWQTQYRGDLLICSSANPKEPGTIAGHALTVCTLSDIEPFADKHLSDAGFDTMPDVPCYAWHLTNFRDIIPFPVKGRLNLYEIDDRFIKYLPENMSDTEADEAFNRYYAPLFS